MARAYKCDRCGKLFEGDPIAEYIAKNIPGNRKFYSIMVETIPDVFSHKMELCFNCYNELKLFLEQKEGKSQ